MKVLPRLPRAVLLNSALGVVLLAALGGAYAAVNSDSTTATPRTDSRTVAVSTGKVQATVTGSGSLASPSDAGVNFTTGGQLSEVAVKAGDKVSKGQVMAKVDDTAARQALAQAKTSLTAAKANLTKVTEGQPASPPAGSGPNPGNSPSHDPSPSPTPSKKPSPNPSPSKPTPTPSDTNTPAGVPFAGISVRNAAYVDGAPAASPSVDPALLLQAQTQVAQAQSAVDNAQRTLDGTVLTAPVDGTIASVGAAVGQTVVGTTYTSGAGTAPGSAPGQAPGQAPGTTGGPGTGGGSPSPSGFIVITNPTGMQVKANFSEADALRLKPGQSATVTLNVQAGTALNAKVLSVSTLAVGGGAGGAAQYPVTLDITSATKDLHTGQSVSVQVVSGEAADALYVPTAALSGTGPTRTVTVVGPDGAAHPASVTVGVEGDTNTQITSGLTQGQKVRVTTVAPSGHSG
ncbi:HlyD family efflux transporter periplasmic adaptor subunit [Streptomyces sp. NPDC052811]|uniref:efflux RND transporter periplasmic adaptor subunit n=1 Tax=Streptomyces sp. NPDC052811 TaxID=3155731 RepID=UPI0034456EFB